MGGQILKPATTLMEASATDAEASLSTKGAAANHPPGGQSNYVTLLTASYSDPSASGLLTLDRVNGFLFFYVHGKAVIPFSVPLQIVQGTGFDLKLAAGGAGVEGRIGVAFYTL